MSETTDDQQSSELNNTGYEIFIALLSILSIVNIVLLIAIDDPNLTSVLRSMNLLFSVIFLGDFALRLAKAESRSRYFFREFGWADLLASLPFEQAKILRVFRLLRVVRLLRAAGARNIARSLIKDRAGSALYLLLIMGILVLQFGSLAILQIEQTADGANITTGSDAIWYVLVTISTVGYGDQFPVTNAGRFLGAFIIVIGVGIFGTFTGYLANFFLSPSRKSKPGDEPTDEADVRARLAELRVLMARQQSEQQAAIDELEGLLGVDGR